VRNYKKYEVWVEAHELLIYIYRQIVPNLPSEEKYGLASQMKRAAYSIPFNIVEGCGRNSDRDFAHFLDMSLGSAHEIEYCIILIRDLGLIDEEQYKLIDRKVNAIKAMLINLIKSIRNPQKSL